MPLIIESPDLPDRAATVTTEELFGPDPRIGPSTASTTKEANMKNTVTVRSLVDHSSGAAWHPKDTEYEEDPVRARDKAANRVVAIVGPVAESKAEKPSAKTAKATTVTAAPVAEETATVPEAPADEPPAAAPSAGDEADAPEAGAKATGPTVNKALSPDADKAAPSLEPWPLQTPPADYVAAHEGETDLSNVVAARLELARAHVKAAAK